MGKATSLAIGRFLYAAATSDTNECILWPFAVNKSNGYGRVRVEGQNHRVHRLVFMRRYGIKGLGKVHLCHRCDTPRCCNPEHMFMGNHAANMADAASKARFPRGEGHRKAILTEDQVREVRRIYQKGSRRGFGVFALAKKYGVHVSSMYQIVNRMTWKWLE